MSNLTARLVETLKSKPEKRLEVADHVVKGLSLRVTASGVKTWALRYRIQNGAQRRLTLGGYPGLSLERARREAKKALGKVADERDPAREKLVERRKQRQARGNTPQTLAELWTVYARDELSKRRASTVAYQTWLWNKHISPRLGCELLTDINRTLVRTELRAIGATAPVTANRAMALLRRLLNYAVEEEIVAASPLGRMSKLYEERSCDRVLSDQELRAFCRALGAAPGRRDVAVSARMCAALKLVLLTAARPGDVAGLRADEIDVATRTWIIPAGRFKTKHVQTVPLSDAAWQVLEGVFHGPPESWAGRAFPDGRGRSRSMSEKSMARAMTRIRDSIAMAHATPHDLRRTAVTYMASERLAIPPHVISEILGHGAEGPAATAVYKRYRYDAEKRAALMRWAAELSIIVTGAELSRENIVRLAPR